MSTNTIEFKATTRDELVGILPELKKLFDITLLDGIRFSLELKLTVEVSK